jgi:hypothetical protein
MDESRSHWRRNPIFLGTFLGWLIGMLWWAGLIVVGTHEGEWLSKVVSLLVYAPLVAIPWAVIGLVAGVVAWAVRGPWVVVASGLGLFGGGVYSLTSSPFDGWLALTMPVYCLGGALAGVAVGAAAGVAWRLLAG